MAVVAEARRGEERAFFPSQMGNRVYCAVPFRQWSIYNENWQTSLFNATVSVVLPRNSPCTHRFMQLGPHCPDCVLRNTRMRIDIARLERIISFPIYFRKFHFLSLEFFILSVWIDCERTWFDNCGKNGLRIRHLLWNDSLRWSKVLFLPLEFFIFR